MKNDAWYLIISHKDDVYEKLMGIFESIKKKITAEYDKDYMKMKFESNNIFPIDKDVNIRLDTIVIRAIFVQESKC